MILCERIIVEEGTRKPSLIGIFSEVNARGFPAAFTGMAVYVALSEGQGQYDGMLRVEFAETGQELLRAEAPVIMKDPLTVTEIHMQFPPVPLPQPGLYRLDFLCDGELLKTRDFRAHDMSKGDG